MGERATRGGEKAKGADAGRAESAPGSDMAQDAALSRFWLVGGNHPGGLIGQSETRGPTTAMRTWSRSAKVPTFARYHVQSPSPSTGDILSMHGGRSCKRGAQENKPPGAETIPGVAPKRTSRAARVGCPEALSREDQSRSRVLEAARDQKIGTKTPASSGGGSEAKQFRILLPSPPPARHEI